MSSDDPTFSRGEWTGRTFQTTHWSVVLRVKDGQSSEAKQALEELCRTYWYPLYAFARRKGHSHEAAQDLTQGFFAKLLGNDRVSLADPERGRFRTFLLHSFENFLRTQHRDATTQKRGGGQEVISWDGLVADERYLFGTIEGTSPTVLFERQWAVVLLESVLNSLRLEFSQNGRVELFALLEPHLWRDELSTSYPEIAESVGMTSGAVRVTVHRLRQRFHELLRVQIAHTVQHPNEIENELQYLRRLWAS